MKEITYDNSLNKKLYKANGRIVKGSFFKSYKSFNGLVMVYNSKYAFDTFENNKKSPYRSILIDEDGNIYINERYEITSWEIADENDYKNFLSILDKNNFKFGIEKSQKVHVSGDNKCLENHIQWAIKYKDPNKIKFICEDKILDRKDIENMELSEGKSILAYYDNGYSYMSVDPISKEKFLEIADEITSMPFTWEHRNVRVVRNNNDFYIQCLIGENKHWSEQSNS